MAKISILKICKNIKLDKGYQNCLTYSETQMVELCSSSSHLINEATNVSFIEPNENSINVPFTYQECLQANYMCFQNPYYSNKWFFAFVDSVEYINDKNTKINYTIDVMSTWWSYWDPVNCFVLREHVNDDTPYINLVDEGLSCGEYKINILRTLQAFNKNNFKCVLGVTQIVYGSTSSYQKYDIPFYSKQGDVFSGVGYIYCNDLDDTNYLLQIYDSAGQSDAIKFMFMCPNEVLKTIYDSYPCSAEVNGETHNFVYNLTRNNQLFNENFTGYLKPTTIDGYNPINKKLLQFPYCYCEVDNHNGNASVFNYEDFNDSTYGFNIQAMLCPSISTKITPINYKNNGIGNNYNYSMSGIKFPICAWMSDVYTNWLTQNGVNLGFTTLNKSEAVGLAGFGSVIAGTVMAVTGVGAVTGIGLIGTGVTGMFSAMQSDYKAQLVPDEVKGNTNTGDINFAIGLTNPNVYEMSIKQEIAKSLDDFFTKYGYKINKIKIPNQIGRQYFNYVQIGDSEIIGYPKTNMGIPQNDMIEINSIYRHGVTLWHSHDRIGNYADNIILAE